MQAVIPKSSWVALTLLVPTLVIGCSSAQDDHAVRQRQLADEAAGAGGMESGGSDTGGSDTGGAESGGSDTGGSDTGGAESGGSDTGGSSDGGSAGAEAGAGGESAGTGGAPGEGGSDTGGFPYYPTGGFAPGPGPTTFAQALGSGLCSHTRPRSGSGGLGALVVLVAAVLRQVRRR